MEFVGTAQQNADVRAFLEKKVDEVLDLFSKSSARATPEFADEILNASQESVVPVSTEPVAPAEPVTPIGGIRRRDLDADRSVFSQRLERQMANTGMAEEEARQAILDRRAARQERLKNLREELGLTNRKARGVLRYDRLNRSEDEDGAAAEANYNRSRRIIDMARRKGLTRAEAANILASRVQA